MIRFVQFVLASVFLGSNVLGAQAPLVTSEGNPIVLDFNTPTPTPTPTATPTPTPKPTPTSTPTATPFIMSDSQLDGWFTQYANHYSVDRSLLRQIAACETSFRPNATNWIYGGMYQFSPNTWSANRKTMGSDPNPDLRFNPEESIRTAAFVLSTRGPSAWPNCSKR
jgi:hypothetical protein